MNKKKKKIVSNIMQGIYWYSYDETIKEQADTIGYFGIKRFEIFSFFLEIIHFPTSKETSS